MNIKKHHLASLFVIIAMIAATLPFISPTKSTQAAAGTSLSLSPASQTVTTGSNIVVSVSIDTGGASINTVQSILSYSAANFSLVSITPGSAFGSFPNSASSGSIQFTAGSTGAVTGVQTVATVTLHSTGIGTSAINLASVCPAGNYSSTCSAAYDSVTSNNDLSIVSNGSYTVAAAPVTPAPTTTPTPTPAASSPSPSTSKPAVTSSGSTKKASSGSTTTTSTATTTATDPAPVITNVKVSDTSTNNATVTWQTNIPASSIVNYGLNDKYGQIAQSGKLTTVHQVKIGTSSLTPGTAYYFVVTSATSSGASATGGAQKFTTTGFEITIRVVDSHGKPIKGAKVTAGGQAGTTNSDGVAVLQDVPAGPHAVVIKSGRKSTSRIVTVGTLNPKTGTYQQQQFSLTAARGSSTAPYVIVALFALLAAGIVLFAPLGTMVTALQRIGKGPGGMGASGGPTPPDSSDNGPADNSSSNSPIQVVSPGSKPSSIPAGAGPLIKINNIQLGKTKNPQPGTVVMPNEGKT